MNLIRDVTSFSLGLFKHKGTWRRTSGSWCEFESYGFAETNKKEEDKATKILQQFGPCSDSFIKFSTENVCPAIVTVFPKKGTAGSGIIIDSNGTVLTHARNIFLPIFRSKDNLMLFGEEFMHRWLYEKFYLGNCGGPIVTLDGEVVGISTKIHLLRSLHNAGSCGTTDATGIEEALCNVGYIGKMVPGIINK